MVGALLVVQLAGLIVPFVLLLPLTTGTQGYLAGAAAASFRITLAVFLLLANCALTVAISVTVFRPFRQRSEALALWLLAAAVIMLVLQAVDNVHVLSMLSLSRRYATQGGSEGLLLVAESVASTRRWAHLTELLAIDAWILLFYVALLRLALVPRAIAAFGLLTVVLHLTGIPLRGFLGYGPVTTMGMAMGLSHLVSAGWLLARGFDEANTRDSRSAARS
jgi:hypothetical protein